MEDQTTDDWLPPGWKVEVRQRRNGKKDKCYYAPCGELRFISRAEVSRYLEKCGSKTEEKEKCSGKQSSKNVIVEKAAAEGLPPGWTKELRITKRANKFYADPVSGYVFRSMKDALRYVETGEFGRLAFKPKDQGSNDEDLEVDKNCEPAIVERQKVAGNATTDETERQSAEQVSNLSGITKEEELLTSASTGEQTSLSKHFHHQQKAGVGAELSSLIPSEAKGLEQIGVKDSEGVHASSNVVGVLLDKQFRENGMTKGETEKTQQGKGKTKLKKAVNIPQRSSKRLAGVALDPTPELKTTRARRSSIKQEVVPDAAENSSPGSCIRGSKQPEQLESALETSCALDASKSKELILAPKNMLSPGDRPKVNGNVGNLETKTQADEDKSVLPMGNAAIRGEHSGNVKSDDKASEVPGSIVDMQLADLWTDPCIAFAIQTLTGIPCDTPKIPESNSCKGPGILATPEVHAERGENGNRRVERQVCDSDMALADPTFRKEHAGKVEKGHKTDGTPGSSLDMPLADIWADPCIEFAIKTLTGAIPVEYDLENRDYFQQQPSSSLTQSNNHLTLPDVGIDNFSQTDFICQQYDVKEKSMSKEHAIMNPIYNYTHSRSGERP
ncbi:hypothetical protein REPUB_Repub08aG0121600 [Reevesia pubescens]